MSARELRISRYKLHPVNNDGRCVGSTRDAQWRRAPPSFALERAKVIEPQQDICSLAILALREKAEESRRRVTLCVRARVFWLTTIRATGLFRRVTDCLMVDCRALLRGSSDWVAAKHLAVSRGAPRRQSSYNREVILRKMSSSSGTPDENGGFARTSEIPAATSKRASRR